MVYTTYLQKQIHFEKKRNAAHITFSFIINPCLTFLLALTLIWDNPAAGLSHTALSSPAAPPLLSTWDTWAFSFHTVCLYCLSILYVYELNKAAAIHRAKCGLSAAVSCRIIRCVLKSTASLCSETCLPQNASLNLFSCRDKPADGFYFESVDKLISVQ